MDHVPEAIEEDSDDELDLILNDQFLHDQEILNDMVDFPGFYLIFNVFKNDIEVNKLSFFEKELISEHLLNNHNILTNELFYYLKEHILKNRALNNPLININLLKKTIMVRNFDARSITKNLSYFFTPNTKTSIDEIERIKKYDYKYLYNEQQQRRDIETDNINMLSLPDEIIERILIMAIPRNDLDILKFFNTRLTCKLFHKIMVNKIFTTKVMESLNINNLIHSKYLHLNSVSTRIFNNLIYEYIHNLFKQYYLSIFGPQLIVALGGFKTFFNMQYIEKLDYKCIDNVCGEDCCKKYHNLHNIANSPITKGIDSKGRQFILFFYKTSADDIYYEFLYQHNLANQNYMTFSGSNLNTFIGNMSLNNSDDTTISYRELHNISYSYVGKLVKNIAYEVILNDKLDLGYEDPMKPVRLFFDRDKIDDYLNNKYNEYYPPFIRIDDRY